MYVADYRHKHAGDVEQATFVEYQDNMVKELRNIARGAQDMVCCLCICLFVCMMG